MWQNIIVRRDISDQEIRRGFAQVFDVPPDSVAIVENLLEHPNYQLPKGCQILIDRVRRGGEFALELTVILHSAQAEAATRENPTDILVGRLSAMWETDVLISEPGPSPYVWRLIGPDGKAQTVVLDAEQLDDAGRFVIVPVPSAREAA